MIGKEKFQEMERWVFLAEGRGIGRGEEAQSGKVQHVLWGPESLMGSATERMEGRTE